MAVERVIAKESEKIKKDWLLLTVIMWLGLPICDLIITVITNLSKPVSLEILAKSFGYMFVYSIGFLIMYFFAYKRRGVYWLTLIFICNVCITAAEVRNSIDQLLNFDGQKMDYLPGALMYLIGMLWWYWKTAQLLGMNKFYLQTKRNPGK